MAENVRSGRGRSSESSAHNSIACEPCRTKKRRCDRTLPVCLQCTHDPSQCHYPEQNKRGLPSGYVNKLEARLAKTEAALFHLLNQRHGGDSQPSLSDIPPAPASSVSMGQNKAERVKEWDQYPLQSMSDVQQWYRSKAIEAGHGASPPMTNRSSISQPTVIQRRKTLWGADIRPMAQNSQPSREWPRPATVTAAPDVATESPDPDSSRAKELSRSQYNMYF